MPAPENGGYGKPCPFPIPRAGSEHELCTGRSLHAPPPHLLPKHPRAGSAVFWDAGTKSKAATQRQKVLALGDGLVVAVQTIRAYSVCGSRVRGSARQEGYKLMLTPFPPERARTAHGYQRKPFTQIHVTPRAHHSIPRTWLGCSSEAGLGISRAKGTSAALLTQSTINSHRSCPVLISSRFILRV